MYFEALKLTDDGDYIRKFYTNSWDLNDQAPTYLFSESRIIGPIQEGSTYAESGILDLFDKRAFIIRIIFHCDKLDKFYLSFVHIGNKDENINLHANLSYPIKLDKVASSENELIYEAHKAIKAIFNIHVQNQAYTE